MSEDFTREVFGIVLVLEERFFREEKSTHPRGQSVESKTVN